MHKASYNRMTSARKELMIYHPFYGMLAMQLKLVERYDIDTMATDGKHIFYNPNFVMVELTHQLMVLAIIAHEILHCAYRHHLRIAGRDLRLWNEACDYVINYELKKHGFMLPPWVFYDTAYAGMTPEEVYNILKQKEMQQKQQQQGQGGGQGQPGQQPGQGQGQGQQPGQQPGQGQGAANDNKAPDPGRMGGVISPVAAGDHVGLEAESQRWEQMVRQAVAIAKNANAGTLPADLVRLVAELNRSRVPWEHKLRRFVDDSVVKTTTWSSPNKRLLWAGIVMPGYMSDRINHIVCGVDTSGSVTNQLLTAYASEITAWLDEGIADRVTVIYTDTVVKNVQVFERGDVVKLDPRGGGGTDFRNFFEYVKKHCYDASVIIFFTDLLCDNWGDQPTVPVLWTMYGTEDQYRHRIKKLPFGESIHIAA